MHLRFGGSVDSAVQAPPCCSPRLPLPQAPHRLICSEPCTPLRTALGLDYTADSSSITWLEVGSVAWLGAAAQDAVILGRCKNSHHHIGSKTCHHDWHRGFSWHAATAWYHMARLLHSCGVPLPFIRMPWRQFTCVYQGQFHRLFRLRWGCYYVPL